MRRLRDSLLLFFVTLSFVAMAAESGPKARVVGLENNQSYMELLAGEMELQRKEDSLQRRIVQVRESFRSDSENRSTYRDEILRLENEIFDTRKRLGLAAGQLNFIEQEFIIKSMGGTSETIDPNSLGAAGDTLQTVKKRVLSANVVYNNFFAEQLVAQDYETLLDAQSKEQAVTNYLKIYKSNNEAILKLLAEYKLVDNAEVADSLYARYTHLSETNAIVADSIGSVWDYVFDNKIFSYNYLLDALHKMDLLSEFEKKGQIVRSKQAQLRDNSTSLEVASYTLQKELLLDYEYTFASLYDVEPALDSLNKIKIALGKAGFGSPKIEVEERLFLDYADFEVSTPAKYNAQNPIPNTIIHPKGVIYRIQVGSYQRAMPVSTFRGVSPLSRMVVERRHIYYLGGYKTLKEARETADRVEKLGFRDPKVAVWDWGSYSLLSDSDLAKIGEVFYQIEILGAGDTLDEAVLRAINETSEGKEISRSGEHFTVGSFSSITDAQRVLEAIRVANPKLDVKTIEI